LVSSPERKGAMWPARQLSAGTTATQGCDVC